jgi:putative salt-induced outer membrane protein YdiY
MYTKHLPIGPYRTLASLAALCTLFTSGNIASAQTQAAAAPTNTAPTKIPWDTTAAVGVTLTRGNSRTFLATFGLDTKRKWNKNEAMFGIGAGYGDDKGVQNTEFVNGFGQYNRLFSDRCYGGLRVDGSYDGIAGLDYRVRISPLAGYYLIKQDNMSLSVEVGPAAVFEKHKNADSETYVGFRAGERFDYKLSATTKFWEALDYVPRIDKWSEVYVLTFEAGIDAAINKHFSLRTVFQNIYDSAPSAGHLHDDMRLVAGAAYKF